VWQGRTWSARPVRVISDSAEERSFYVAPRNPRIVPVGPDEVELRLPVDPWAFRRRTGSAWRILSFAWPDVAYAVLGWWDAQTEEFGGWYVNLQSPLVATDEGFDYTDHLLDVLVAVDGTWRWKDEDELSDAVALSIFSPADAEGFYEAGRDAVDRITERPPAVRPRLVELAPGPFLDERRLPRRMESRRPRLKRPPENPHGRGGVLRFPLLLHSCRGGLLGLRRGEPGPRLDSACRAARR